MPSGRDVVVIAGAAAAAIAMLSALAALPALFAAWTVKPKVPGVAGVPEIVPVAVFRLNPSGGLPLATVHVTGAVPPALSVWL
jgi:hypothetical protein